MNLYKIGLSTRAVSQALRPGIIYSRQPFVRSFSKTLSVSEGSPKKPNRFAEQYKKASSNTNQGLTSSNKQRKPIEQESSSRKPNQRKPPQHNHAPEQKHEQPQQGKSPKEKAPVDAPKQSNPPKKTQQWTKNANPNPSGRNSTPSQQKAQRREKANKPKQRVKLNIPSFISVSNIASIMRITVPRMMKKLEQMGFDDMTPKHILDKENAALIAEEFGFDVTVSDDKGLDVFPSEEKEDMLKPRAPVVTIMGHVDHGKTTILDYLRKSSIVQGEFGGITQHIGAFSVLTPISKKKITFLDTPGHAAFLSMRERGAIVTDIVILVVAADDSVMPQTIEAIKHAKKSGVPIIVALNKCDKPGVNPDKVVADLSTHDIDVEDYGGETQVVRVSGKTGLNMDKLEEAVITLSELLDFQAEPQGVRAEGWVIESEVVKGLGNIATVLVKRGTVKTGSFLLAGSTYCKVRGMKDEKGKPVKIAGPSTPVQIWGWKELPQAGDQILEAESDQICRKVIRNREERAMQLQQAKDIEAINERRQKEVEELQRQEKIKELNMAGLETSEFLKEEGSQTQFVNYIIKSDVYGSAEAIKESIDGLGNDEIKAKVISYDAGAPTDSEVDNAAAFKAQILCFNIKVPKQIQSKADRSGVKLHDYNVIYRLIEGVTAELTSRLKPHIEIKVLAKIDLVNVFKISGRNKSTTKVAGCKVNSGILKRSSKIRVLRGDSTIYTGTLSSLKYVRQDISEATKGQECGLAFHNWDKFEEGDIIEAYEEIEIPGHL